MKKVIFRAPVMTASGYGTYSRALLKALVDDGRFDITVVSTGWGVTPVLYDRDPWMDKIRELSGKFNPQTMGPKDFDASFQVTIPNEFSKMAPVNICCTAGIETDRVSPLWQQKCNEFADVVVVPSLHSARSFTTGIYGAEKGPNQLLLRKPLYVLPIWIDTGTFNTDPVSPELQKGFDFPAKFNFVSVGLGLEKNEPDDRKNYTQLIRWFCEQFKANPDVGLVLKLSMVNYSRIDFENTKNRILQLKGSTGCGQFPRIHLIHGRLRDGELAALYKHPNVKAYVSLAHGEGFGLPIIEAAACGLPVVATNWSGHLDFLRINGKSLFIPVRADLNEIPNGAVWDTVHDRGTKWAHIDEHDAKLKMAKVVLSYDRPKEWAGQLAAHIHETYHPGLAKEWVQDMYDLIDGKRPHLSKYTLNQTAKSDKKLDRVALVSIGTNTPNAALHALKKSMEQIKFAYAVLFVSNQLQSFDPGDPNIRVEFIKPFRGIEDHDQFVMKQLIDHIPVGVDHFLTVQPDGYVLNGSAWDDAFLEYDYVGAPWFWNNVVGNAGFCLRSTRLAHELQGGKYESYPMDTNICVKYRKELEEKGFKWAPVELASKFSVENLPYESQFGWHGENPFNGERVEG